MHFRSHASQVLGYAAQATGDVTALSSTSLMPAFLFRPPHSSVCGRRSRNRRTHLQVTPCPAKRRQRQSSMTRARWMPSDPSVQFLNCAPYPPPQALAPAPPLECRETCRPSPAMLPLLPLARHHNHRSRSSRALQPHPSPPPPRPISSSVPSAISNTDRSCCAAPRQAQPASKFPLNLSSYKTCTPPASLFVPGVCRSCPSPVASSGPRSPAHTRCLQRRRLPLHAAEISPCRRYRSVWTACQIRRLLQR